MKIKYRKVKLSNGIPVLLLKNSNSTVLSFQVWVKTGSKNEKPGITGISHMLEHMMFKGSKKYGAEEHARIVESLGGECNAFTDFDETVYYENIAPEHLKTVVYLEEDRFKNLMLSKNEFLKEKKVVLEERLYRTENSPMGRAVEELFSLTFYAHPYHWPVIGWRSDIENYTVEKVKRYFKERYAPENIFIVLSGRFNEDEAVEILSNTFGNWRRDFNSNDISIDEPEQEGKRISEIKMRVNVPFIAGAYKIPSYSHEDIAALSVYERIVSGGDSSRLMRELVFKKGISLYTGGGVYALKDSGIFYFIAMVNEGSDPLILEEEASKIIESAYEIKDEELFKAKNQLKAETISVFERAQTLGLEVGKNYYYTGDPFYFKKLLKKYDEITKEDIIEVAKKYLREDKRTVVRILPERK